jgi:ABC-type lipoprotein release transport system permease subunit
MNKKYNYTKTYKTEHRIIDKKEENRENGKEAKMENWMMMMMMIIIIIIIIIHNIFFFYWLLQPTCGF